MLFAGGGEGFFLQVSGSQDRREVSKAVEIKMKHERDCFLLVSTDVHERYLRCFSFANMIAGTWCVSPREKGGPNPQRLSPLWVPGRFRL